MESCCCDKSLRLRRNIFHRPAAILLLLCFKLFSITYVWPCWFPSIWKSTAGAVTQAITHAMVFIKKMENSGDLYINHLSFNWDNRFFMFIHPKPSLLAMAVAMKLNLKSIELRSISYSNFLYIAFSLNPVSDKIMRNLSIGYRPHLQNS